MKKKEGLEMITNEIIKIFEFCSTLIKEERVGSRFEGNDIEKLWKLGDLIISFYKEPDYSTLLPKLQQIHTERNIRYDDRFYRAAIIFRKYWSNESDYLGAIKNINVWTKLRELYPICERILKGNSEHSRKEVDVLIARCKDKTYMEVRDLFIRFREKDDTLLKQGIDVYEFTDLFVEVTSQLEEVLEKENLEFEKRIRENYTSEQFRGFRLLLSALQKEDVYQNKRWNVEIKKVLKNKINDSDFEIAKRINNIFMTIYKFINIEKARIEIRKTIPITFIGNLSTYLRAIESDANKKQFKANKDILKKFIGSMESQNS